MKKILKLIIVLFMLAIPPLAYAGHTSAVNIFEHSCGTSAKLSNSTPCKDVSTQNNDNSNPIISIIKAVINVVSYFVGVAAVIGIIISGIRLTVANGDSNAIASARTGLLYSIIGVGVTIFAQIIVVYILKRVN